MSTPERPDRGRAIPIILIVVATLIGLVSVFGLWVKRQALETETFANTSEQLLEDAEIRDTVANFVVTTIYDNVDVEAEIAGRLPPQLAGLAGPIAGGLRNAATSATKELLEQPKVQAIWKDATAAAQEKLIALIEDEGEFVSTTGGAVTLDLTSLVSQVAADVGIGENLASKLPPEASSIEIMQSDELAAAQTGVKALKTIAYVLSFLTLILYAVAIALARGRRRETLRAVGFSFAFIGIVVLLVRNVGGTIVTDALASDSTAEPSVTATWEISTSLLTETGQSLLAYGIAIVIAAWLAGPTRYATRIRHAIAPYFRRPLVALTAAATILILLFWWDPVVATHRIVPSLLLCVLIFFGVEMLRRQVIREEEAAPAPKPAATAATAGTGDDRVAQLERLAGLRESGVLDDAEFAAEKQRILGTG